MAYKQEIKQISIDKLIEYDRNPRINDHAVDKIAAAIKEFGFRVPIIARSDGLIVDGHLRLKAAKKLGLNSVPVLLAENMSETQIKAFRISVNKMAELADWDLELLKLEFDDLKAEDYDLELTGFSEDEINNLYPDFNPAEAEDQSKLDVISSKIVECPNCGHEFDSSK